MATLASVEPREWSFLAFLREELRSRPGRLAAAARIATCCTIVVATGMLYQIPEPAYSAYIVFFLGRGDTAVTVRTGLVGAVAITFATLLSLLFYALDAGEPALRLPLMGASCFLGMFLMRTMAIGPIAFLSGFLLVVTQGIIDVIPNLEALTRFILWLWVVITLPDAVTVLVNLLTSPSPRQLARQSALHLLDALADALRCGNSTRLAQASAEALDLIELRQRAEFLDQGLRSLAAIDASLIETLEELISLAMLLPATLAGDVRVGLAEACETCRGKLIGGTARQVAMPASLTGAALADLAANERPVVIAMRLAFDRLAAGLAERAGPRSQIAEAHEPGLFVPDAFSNPEHVRFALKTTIAVVSAYVIYTGADWPGIRTALITCFFVAQGTLGETLHKLTLRLGGAVIGAAIGALSIVYLLPHMTDIGDLSLLIAGVSALCAWVATSSERLAYAGMQMALAFFLGVLQGYGPSTDLTVLRDRMVGILLGNLLMSLVFSTLWPTSAAAQARQGLAAALRALAGLLHLGAAPFHAGQRLAVARAVTRARYLTSIAAFEIGSLGPHPARHAVAHGSIDDLDRIAAAAFVVAEHRAIEAPSSSLGIQDTAIAAWLTTSADCLVRGATLPATPDPQAASDELVVSPTIEGRVAAEARLLLIAQIEGAVG